MGEISVDALQPTFTIDCGPGFEDSFLEGLQSSAVDPLRGQESKLPNSGHVLGGTDARVQSWKRQVVLIQAANSKNAVAFGSGTLIAHPLTQRLESPQYLQYVVTAAHCVCYFDDGPSKFSKYAVGVLTGKEDNPSASKLKPGRRKARQEKRFKFQKVRPEQVYIYPHYTETFSPFHGTDFALIHLPNPVPVLVTMIPSLYDPERSISFLKIYGYPGEKERSYIQYDSGDLMTRAIIRAMRDTKDGVGENEWMRSLHTMESDGGDKVVEEMNLKRKMEILQSKAIFKNNLIGKQRETLSGIHHAYYRRDGHILLRYINQTSKGMSGGALLIGKNEYRRKFAGVHVMGGLNNIHGGSLFTPKVMKWITDIQENTYRRKINHGDSILKILQLGSVADCMDESTLAHITVENFEELLMSGCLNANLEYAKYICEMADRSGWKLTKDVLQNALTLASFIGKVDLVRYLLRRNADPNHRINHTRTPFNRQNEFRPGAFNYCSPIHAACLAQHNADVIKVLLEHKANPSFQEPFRTQPKQFDVGARSQTFTVHGHSLLHRCIYANDYEAVRTLIEHKADLEARLNSGHTPFLAASLESCSLRLMKLLIDSKCDVNATDDSFGNAIIAHCQIAGCLAKASVIKLLVESGVDVNYVAPDGRSVLQWVISRDGTTESTMILIENNADIFYQTSRGESVLHCASQYSEQFKTLKYLLSQKCDINSLMESKFGVVEHVSYAGVKSVDYLTPIARAVQSCNWDGVIYLCDQGAKLNYQCGIAPLMVLSRGEEQMKLKVLKYLVRKGLDVNKFYGPLQKCCLQRVAFWGMIPIAKFLLEECHMDPNYACRMGHTPMCEAAIEKHYDLLKLLIQYGGDDRPLNLSTGRGPNGLTISMILMQDWCKDHTLPVRELLKLLGFSDSKINNGVRNMCAQMGLDITKYM